MNKCWEGVKYKSVIVNGGCHAAFSSKFLVPGKSMDSCFLLLVKSIYSLQLT